ncbi:uncharacterized protein AAG666_025761 isoform 1-T1 [Megaptera novaeangliae]
MPRQHVDHLHTCRAERISGTGEKRSSVALEQYGCLGNKKGSCRFQLWTMCESRKETHCWIKDHLSTEERILNTLWQQNTTGKRKRLDKEQWKDRIKTNTRLHLLECMSTESSGSVPDELLVYDWTSSFSNKEVQNNLESSLNHHPQVSSNRSSRPHAVGSSTKPSMKNFSMC